MLSCSTAGVRRMGTTALPATSRLACCLPKAFTRRNVVVELHRWDSGGRRRCERSLLDRDALTAFVVFVELRGEERREIFLQAGEVGGELQAESVGGGSFGQHRDCGGRDDVGLLAFDGEGDFLWRDFEGGVLRGEDCRRH